MQLLPLLIRPSLTYQAFHTNTLGITATQNSVSLTLATFNFRIPPSNSLMILSQNSSTAQLQNQKHFIKHQKSQKQIYKSTIILTLAISSPDSPQLIASLLSQAKKNQCPELYMNPPKAIDMIYTVSHSPIQSHPQSSSKPSRSISAKNKHILKLIPQHPSKSSSKPLPPLSKPFMKSASLPSSL